VMSAVWGRVRSREGKMVVCNVSDMGVEIFQVAKFDTLWPICASLEEAMESVRQ